METSTTIIKNAASSIARQFGMSYEPFVVRLSQALHDQLVRHADESLPFECCGLLLGRRDGCVIDIDSIVPAANVSAGDRRVSFEVDPQTLLDTIGNERTFCDSLHLPCGFGQREYTPQLVGIYHSHPNGRAGLSATDLESAWTDMVQLVIVASQDRHRILSAWFIPTAPSLNIPRHCRIEINDNDE